MGVVIQPLLQLEMILPVTLLIVAHSLLTSCTPPNCLKAQGNQKEQIVEQSNQKAPEIHHPLLQALGLATKDSSEPVCLFDRDTTEQLNPLVAKDLMSRFQVQAIRILNKEIALREHTSGLFYHIECNVIGITLENEFSEWIVFKSDQQFQNVSPMLLKIQLADSAYFPVLCFYPELPFIDAKSAVICEYPLGSATLIDSLDGKEISSNRLMLLMGQVAAFVDVVHSLHLTFVSLGADDFILDSDMQLIFISLYNLRPQSSNRRTAERKKDWIFVLKLWEQLFANYQLHTNEPTDNAHRIRRRIRELEVLIQRKTHISLVHINLKPHLNSTAKQSLKKIKRAQ